MDTNKNKKGLQDVEEVSGTNIIVGFYTLTDDLNHGGENALVHALYSNERRQ